jgi:hypothetical protein
MTCAFFMHFCRWMNRKYKMKRKRQVKSELHDRPSTCLYARKSPQWKYWSYAGCDTGSPKKLRTSFCKKSTIFWNRTSCTLIGVHRRFGVKNRLSFRDKRTTNSSETSVEFCSTLQPRRSYSSWLPPWAPQIQGLFPNLSNDFSNIV